MSVAHCRAPPSSRATSSRACRRALTLCAQEGHPRLGRRPGRHHPWRVSRVLPPHGRVLVAETLVPPGNDFAPIKLVDLNMLAVTGGVERSVEEFRALFSRCGLALRRVIHTSAPIQVLEAEPG